MDRVTVLLAEDHAVVREGTREMLERDPLISVVGEAEDGAAAVALAADLSPDVVLLDLGLPVLNGIEAARRIRALPRPPRVLILSAYDDNDYVTAAVEAGASGYLLKTSHMRDVVAAIRSVALGEVVLHPAVAARLLMRSRARDQAPEMLTDRELQVLRHAARGARNKEIAHLLSVSTRTVEAHFTSVFNKLGVTSRTEAILQAVARGWLALDRERELP
ncbi:MAG TPA: response regulator transcription factor [Candidatus Limnocylindrales bacterium]|nr:response regulator transcription factor [Candidatus Limnocylindrales bacterium]